MINTDKTFCTYENIYYEMWEGGRNRKVSVIGKSHDDIDEIRLEKVQRLVCRFNYQCMLMTERMGMPMEMENLQIRKLLGRKFSLLQV